VINRSEILGKLAPFKNYQVIVSHDQTVGEIIDGILRTHEKYKSEYDKISSYFIGDNEIETAQNIWNFLKSNVPYYIEDTKSQTLRSPSAIVAMPGDCKSYALFANGILDSLNRKGVFNIPLAYRFASYKDNNKEPQHVFSVLYPGTNNEIWIDPVLKRFNEKREPTFYKDKKIKMALIALSGVESATTTEQLEAYRDKLVNERDRLLVAGQIAPGSSKELQYKVAINKITTAIQDANISGFGEIGKQVDSFSKVGFVVPVIGVDTKDIGDVANLITNLFSNAPNPNDWMGWEAQERKQNFPLGTSANFFTKFDGDSVQNEALNILSWIKAYGINTVLGYNSWNKWTVTIDDLVSKITRGGYPQEAQALKKAITPSVSNLFSPSTPGTTSAGMNIWLTLGLAGAAIFLITKMKK
jgi:hypothetical protein